MNTVWKVDVFSSHRLLQVEVEVCAWFAVKLRYIVALVRADRISSSIVSDHHRHLIHLTQADGSRSDSALNAGILDVPDRSVTWRRDDGLGSASDMQHYGGGKSDDHVRKGGLSKKSNSTSQLSATGKTRPIETLRMVPLSFWVPTTDTAHEGRQSRVSCSSVESVNA